MPPRWAEVCATIDAGEGVAQIFHQDCDLVAYEVGSVTSLARHYFTAEGATVGRVAGDGFNGFSITCGDRCSTPIERMCLWCGVASSVGYAPPCE